MACLRGEDQLSSLIEHAPLAIGLTRNGRFLYVNACHLEMFGYQSLDEIIGRPISELFASQDRERAMDLNRRLERGLLGSTGDDYMGLRRDGSTFPFHVAITKMELADGPVIVGFLNGISPNEKRRRMRSGEAMTC